jgi:excisionase family DNA binding protein
MSKSKRKDRRSEIHTIGDDDEMNLSKYVTTRQAADLLGVKTEHINHLLIAKKIDGRKLGYSWLVFKPSLEKYLANKSKGGRPTSGTPQLKIENDNRQE